MGTLSAAKRGPSGRGSCRGPGGASGWTAAGPAWAGPFAWYRCRLPPRLPIGPRRRP